MIFSSVPWCSVGGIDEVSAELEMRSMIASDPHARTQPQSSPEGHGSEAERRDSQTRVTEGHVMVQRHGGTPGRRQKPWCPRRPESSGAWAGTARPTARIRRRSFHRPGSTAHSETDSTVVALGVSRPVLREISAAACNPGPPATPPTPPRGLLRHSAGRGQAPPRGKPPIRSFSRQRRTSSPPSPDPRAPADRVRTAPAGEHGQEELVEFAA